MKSKTGQNVVILLSALTILLSVLSPPAGARPVKVWTFQELTKQADLVVVATARSSADTKNFVYPHVEDKTWVQVDTLFSVEAILKGELKSGTLTVQHFRYHSPKARMTVIDGPSFVEFSPAKKHRYLMFLQRSSNGLYVPLTGQYDPDRSFFLIEDYHFTKE